MKHKTPKKFARIFLMTGKCTRAPKKRAEAYIFYSVVIANCVTSVFNNFMSMSKQYVDTNNVQVFTNVENDKNRSAAQAKSMTIYSIRHA